MSQSSVHIISFDSKEVSVVLAHAKKCVSHSPVYEQLFDARYRLDGKEPTLNDEPTEADIDQGKLPWGLTLVADHGVYLMSNGLPRDVVDGGGVGPGEGRSRVCYAKGLNPDVDEFDNWWERKRAVCGGDDQAIALNGVVVERYLAVADALRLKIRTNGTYMTDIKVAPLKRARRAVVSHAK